MLKGSLKKYKAIVMPLALAFFFTTFTLFLILVIFNKKIEKTFTLINRIATTGTKIENKDKNIKINIEEKRLTEYPNFGEIWGSLEIPSVGINVNIYHGETLDLLKYGAGHHTGTYFPGEGGTIIIAAHNTEGYFMSLPNVNIGDEIVINAVYGTYRYKIDRTEIVNAKVLGDNLQINKDSEILMLYTCYPVDTPGFKSDRFVVYASLVGDTYE